MSFFKKYKYFINRDDRSDLENVILSIHFSCIAFLSVAVIVSLFIFHVPKAILFLTCVGFSVFPAYAYFNGEDE